jgi:amino acid transporter
MTKPVKALLYYFIAALIIFAAIKMFPSGSCGPSLDVLIFLGIILVSLVLFVINLFRTIKGNKTTKVSTIIHFLGCAALIIYLFTGGSL